MQYGDEIYLRGRVKDEGAHNFQGDRDLGTMVSKDSIMSQEMDLVRRHIPDS